MTSFSPPTRRFRSREHLDLPALLLGEARIHAEDFGGKERSLVAAGAGADFDDDVLLVVRIFGQEQDLQFFLDASDASLQPIELFLRVRPHLCVLLIRKECFAVSDAFRKIFIFAILLNNSRNLAVRFGSLLISRQ